MSRLRPQASGQEILIVLFVLLFLHPLGFLLVGCGFEGYAADVEEYADHVGESQEGQSGEGGCGDGVEGEDGQKAQGYPGCLGEEGAEEFGSGGADRVETGVAAVF